ncbi:nitroreductase [Herbihabitans rhizosphaerae]|uniref:Nitroreductase n=1 Tax=Herbihabitans rhizosphaerae TaxID=1872711 RepID=A0A4Q7L6Q9_9PSEU|nr:nitroreductase family protein [Herbihabitans rhizosphaerae]RZS44956.1 nitroreductase [Herbihabitans rhizosphaerae]
MTGQFPEIKRAATSAPPHEIIATRWSPRAIDPDAEVPEESLRAMLEAARWAPSSGNTQPARYLLGRRGDSTYDRIFGALTRGNKAWAHAAPVLLLGCAMTSNAKGDIPLAEYGVGLASENLVLQAVAEGLVAHQMGGFDPDAAARVFALPDNVRPLACIAVGRLAAVDELPDDLRDRELAPRKRIPLDEVAQAEWGRPAFG